VTRKDRVALVAHELIALRAEMVRQESEAAVEEVKKGVADLPVEKIVVPRAKMRELVVPDAAE